MDVLGGAVHVAWRSIARSTWLRWWSCTLSAASSSSSGVGAHGLGADGASAGEEGHGLLDGVCCACVDGGEAGCAFAGDDGDKVGAHSVAPGVMGMPWVNWGLSGGLRIGVHGCVNGCAWGAVQFWLLGACGWPFKPEAGGSGASGIGLAALAHASCGRYQVVQPGAVVGFRRRGGCGDAAFALGVGHLQFFLKHGAGVFSMPARSLGGMGG